MKTFLLSFHESMGSDADVAARLNSHGLVDLVFAMSHAIILKTDVRAPVLSEVISDLSNSPRFLLVELTAATEGILPSELWKFVHRGISFEELATVFEVHALPDADEADVAAKNERLPNSA